METIQLRTHRRCEMITITSRVAEVVSGQEVASGAVVVHVPHTTAGVTINENADPDVVHDMLLWLEQQVPEHYRGFRHAEGNSDAHIKASLMGPSQTILIENGRLQLGTWQGIYFCEFDGPRTRKVFITVL